LGFSGIAPAGGDDGNPKQASIRPVSILRTALYTAGGVPPGSSTSPAWPRATRGEWGGDDEVKGLDNAIHGERAFEIEF